MIWIVLENFSSLAHILPLKQGARLHALTVVGFTHRERNDEYLIDDHSGIALSWKFAHVAVQLGLGLLSGRRTRSHSGGGFGSTVVSRVDRLSWLLLQFRIKKGRRRKSRGAQII
jgi:hypothetical protein